MSNPYAVRWTLNTTNKMYLRKYSKWHYTKDASFTLCGLPIPVGGEGHRFLPETDEEVSIVNCKKCLRKAKLND